MTQRFFCNLLPQEAARLAKQEGSLAADAHGLRGRGLLAILDEGAAEEADDTQLGNETRMHMPAEATHCPQGGKKSSKGGGKGAKKARADASIEDSLDARAEARPLTDKLPLKDALLGRPLQRELNGLTNSIDDLAKHPDKAGVLVCVKLHIQMFESCKYVAENLPKWNQMSTHELDSLKTHLSDLKGSIKDWPDSVALMILAFRVEQSIPERIQDALKMLKYSEKADFDPTNPRLCDVVKDQPAFKRTKTKLIVSNVIVVRCASLDNACESLGKSKNNPMWLAKVLQLKFVKELLELFSAMCNGIKKERVHAAEEDLAWFDELILILRALIALLDPDPQHIGTYQQCFDAVSKLKERLVFSSPRPKALISPTPKRTFSNLGGCHIRIMLCAYSYSSYVYLRIKALGPRPNKTEGHQSYRAKPDWSGVSVHATEQGVLSAIQ